MDKDVWQLHLPVRS